MRTITGGWAQGLDKAGYATAGKYAPALISIIESNNLQRYDRMVMEEMNAKGLKPGQGSPQLQPAHNNGMEHDYSFPLKREEFLFVTSPFGMRTDPMDSSRQQMHKGMDIRSDNEAVLATEKDGKVVEVNDNANTVGENPSPSSTHVTVAARYRSATCTWGHHPSRSETR